VLAAAANGQAAARTPTVQAMPRWNLADSEAGHGSTCRWISRPESDTVQVSLTGQELHTVGSAR